MNRNRTNWATEPSGSATCHVPQWNFPSSDVYVRKEVCNDIVDGTRDDHPLEIDKLYYQNQGRLEGYVAGDWGFVGYHSWIPSALQVPRPISHGETPGVMQNPTVAATAALSRTNPNRPEVSLPLAIAELRDLPGLFKDVGRWFIDRKILRPRRIAKEFGNAYLAGVFGLAPLLRDIQDTLDFQASTARRAKEIERLYSKGGLKRRITLAEGETNGADWTGYINSLPTGILVTTTQKTSFKQWATLRWVPTAIPNTPSDKLYQQMARRAIFGISGAVTGRPDGWGLASDLWNVLPWSWMVDWFANYGDYFNAHRNTIPVAPSGHVNIMTHIKTSESATRIPVNNDTGWCSGGDFVAVRETKLRQLGTAGLAASMPFMSASKLSILGALRIQRLKVY